MDTLRLLGHTGAGVGELGGKGAPLLLAGHGDVSDGDSVVEPAHHLVLQGGVAELLDLDGDRGLVHVQGLEPKHWYKLCVSHYNLINTVDITSNITAHNTAKITADSTAHFTANITDDITADITAKTTGNITVKLKQTLQPTSQQTLQPTLQQT